MSIENEEISIILTEYGLVLRTEQTVVNQDVFTSMRDAINKKNIEKWRDSITAKISPLAGIALSIEGLRNIYVGYESRNYEDMFVGFILLYTGFRWVAIDTFDYKNRAELAKRQLEKLQSTIRSVTSNN